MGLALAVLLTLQADSADAAVRKGLDALQSTAAETREERDLLLWTFVKTGVPETNPRFGELLRDLLRAPLQSTRHMALQAMILEAIDPLKYRVRIAHCAQYLVDNQCADGLWDAGTEVVPPEVPAPQAPPRPAPRAFGVPERPKPEKLVIVRKRQGGSEGDPVLSRWAAWGLVACRQAGMATPDDVHAKAAAACRTAPGDAADRVSSLACQLYLGGKDWKKDPDVLKALERLADPARPVDPRSLYLLKRAMIHYGSERLGGREWWPDGVRILAAAQQADGSWGGLEDTCTAVLFLHVPRIPSMHQPDRR